MELTDSDESQDSLKMIKAIDIDVKGDLIVDMPAFSHVHTGRQSCSRTTKITDKMRILPTVTLLLSID